MSDIRVEQADGILTLSFDRPDKRNAITDAMYGTLAAALIAAESDAAVRVILFRGEGEGFTAGNDLGDFAATTSATITEEKNVTRFLKALARAQKPVVAAVQGNAVGVGTTMLLHCDLVVLADDARLITPFVNLALVPEAASSALLPARIGYTRAFQMFALGTPVEAKDALAWGLCNAVVARDALDATARDLAQRLAAQPAGALATTKRLMRDPAVIMPIMDREAVEFAARLVSPEAKEAFAAFAERRKPDFTRV